MKYSSSTCLKTKSERSHNSPQLKSKIVDLHTYSVVNEYDHQSESKDMSDSSPAEYDMPIHTAQYLPKNMDDAFEKPVAARSSKKKSKSDSNLFLVRRACFRGFSKYYTNLFAHSNYAWQRQRGNKKKKTDIMVILKRFASDEFGKLIDTFSENQWSRFRKTLMRILFSQRYKKGDDFLEDIDFSGIRNVLYHYTTEARIEFLSDPQLCFLFHNFYAKHRDEFLNSKVQEECKLNMYELKQELAILDEECLMTLEKHNPF